MIGISINGTDTIIHSRIDLLVWDTLFVAEVVSTLKELFTLVCAERRVKSLMSLLLKTTGKVRLTIGANGCFLLFHARKPIFLFK